MIGKATSLISESGRGFFDLHEKIGRRLVPVGRVVWAFTTWEIQPGVFAILGRDKDGELFVVSSEVS